MQVRKRNGDLQPFEKEKLIGSIVRAGGGMGLGEDIADQIMNWMTTHSEEGVIESTEIWEKTIELLQEIDTSIADAYQSFRGN